jgi:hypothetical protein
MDLDIKQYAFRYAYAKNEDERESIFLEVKNEINQLFSNPDQTSQKTDILAIYDQILVGVKEIQASINQGNLANIQ